MSIYYLCELCEKSDFLHGYQYSIINIQLSMGDYQVRRFFVEEIVQEDEGCSIRGSEARHVSKVLRMGPGDQLILMDQKGSHFLGRIKSASTREVRVLLERTLPKPLPSPVKIILCQALIKSRQMDYVIQKTSELGVDRIFPFMSKRTETSFSKERLANKMRHWQEIAISSTKQCGRIRPVEIASPEPFEELMEKWKEADGVKLILWEEETSRDLKGVLKESSQDRIFIAAVGPEGGFTRKEIEDAEDAGFAPVSLGTRILRSETAASTIVALVQYEWGDLCLRQASKPTPDFASS